MPGVLIYNEGDFASCLPGLVGVLHTKVTAVSLTESVLSTHVLLLCVLVHEIQFVHTQKTLTVHQGSVVCVSSNHLFNRLLLNGATMCQALFWELGGKSVNKIDTNYTFVELMLCREADHKQIRCL